MKMSIMGPVKKKGAKGICTAMYCCIVWNADGYGLLVLQLRLLMEQLQACRARECQ